MLENEWYVHARLPVHPGDPRGPQLLSAVVPIPARRLAEENLIERGRAVYCPLKSGRRFSRNACLASLASSEPCRIPPALDVSTIVVSRELSSAARIIRLLIHCTMGGVRMMRSHSSRVVSSSFAEGTR